MHRATRVTWSCSSGNLLKVTCPVYATVHVYIKQVTFSKVPEKQGNV